uniref:Uncharacterized protein n=1 Tax=Arundo donax TaxID=35708 RepID=A0A0A9CR39_ARUDO
MTSSVAFSCSSCVEETCAVRLMTSLSRFSTSRVFSFSILFSKKCARFILSSCSMCSWNILSSSDNRDCSLEEMSFCSEESFASRNSTVLLKSKFRFFNSSSSCSFCVRRPCNSNFCFFRLAVRF